MGVADLATISLTTSVAVPPPELEELEELELDELEDEELDVVPDELLSPPQAVSNPSARSAGRVIDVRI